MSVESPMSVFGANILRSKLDNWQNWLSTLKSGYVLVACELSWVVVGIREYLKSQDSLTFDQAQLIRAGKYCLVALPVEYQEQQTIYFWLQNWYLTKWLAVTARYRFPATLAEDLKFIYNLEVTVWDEWTLLQSADYDQDQIDMVVDQMTVSYPFDNLDPVRAVYSAICVMENTNYIYPVEWLNGRLNIRFAGYQGSEDIKQEYLRVLGQTSILTFTPVLAPTTGSRSFYCQGSWYAVLPNQKERVECPYDHLHPDYPFESLGYLVEFSRLEFNVPIGYTTVTDGVQTVTTYYYLTSAGRRVDFHQELGPNTVDTCQKLQEEVNLGKYFNPVTIAIYQRYPGYVI